MNENLIAFADCGHGDGKYAVYVYSNTKSNLLEPSENAT